MSKPISKPDWIPDSDPAKIIAPSDSKQNAGWLSAEKPPYQYFNWFWNLVSKWLAYLETITDQVPITNGGTGSDTASGARTNLGLGSIATQDADAIAITGGSILGITDLAIADGGTGASTAVGALTNLGLTATASEINGVCYTCTATASEINRTIVVERIKNAELVYQTSNLITISFPFTEPGGGPWSDVTGIDITKTTAAGGNVKVGVNTDEASKWYYVYISNNFTIVQPIKEQFLLTQSEAGESGHTLIGAVFNDSGSNIRPFHQFGRFVAWTTPVYDLNSGTAVTYTALVLTIPKIALNAQIRTYASAGTAGSLSSIGISIRPGGTSWNDAEAKVSLLQVGLNGGSDNCFFLTTAGDAVIYTNSSQQIEYKIISDGTTLSAFIYTLGYWIR